MSENAFFNRKVKTLFTRLDLDRDGSIDAQDFAKWGDKLMSYGVLNAEQKSNLKKQLQQLWVDYFCSIDKSGNSDGKVSCDELTEYIKLAQTNEAKRQSLKRTIPLIFETIDTDRDDAVSKNEFANYFKSLNINDQATADEVFAQMDKDNDGSLSKKEFSEFGELFFTSMDENDPSKNFFGKLV